LFFPIGNAEEKGSAPVHHLMPLVGDVDFHGLEYLNAGAANVLNIAMSLAFLAGYD
jgi:hypothetical protein